MSRVLGCGWRTEAGLYSRANRPEAELSQAQRGGLYMSSTPDAIPPARTREWGWRGHLGSAFPACFAQGRGREER